MPMLAIIFSAVGILGGHLVGVDWLGVDSGSYWSIMQATVDWNEDVVNGVIKSIVFALVVVWVALFKGYACVPTSEGISQATTETVWFFGNEYESVRCVSLPVYCSRVEYFS